MKASAYVAIFGAWSSGVTIRGAFDAPPVWSVILALVGMLCLGIAVKNVRFVLARVPKRP